MSQTCDYTAWSKREICSVDLFTTVTIVTCKYCTVYMEQSNFFHLKEKQNVNCRVIIFFWANMVPHWLSAAVREGGVNPSSCFPDKTVAASILLCSPGPWGKTYDKSAGFTHGGGAPVSQSNLLQAAPCKPLELCERFNLWQLQVELEHPGEQLPVVVVLSCMVHWAVLG